MADQSSNNLISFLIPEQVPDYVNSEHPNFVNFVKAYYEFLEQGNGPVYRSKKLLDYSDIDDTLPEFIKYFQREFVETIPDNILGDKKLFIKFARDLYRRKGSPNAFKFLFRQLFDEEIELFFPQTEILRASDGRYVKENTIRVSGPFTNNPNDFGGKTVTGQVSGATAFVERAVSTVESGINIFELFLIDIEGTFVDNEFVVTDSGNISGRIVSSVGPINSVNITFGGARHNLGDVVNFTSASGAGANGTITGTTDTALTVDIIDGGSGYRVGTPVTFTGGDGVGASFTVGSITNTTNVTISNTSYTVGTISTLQIISQGSGYTIIPEATIRDDLIADENLSDVQFTLVDGGSGYTNNAIVSVTGGGGTGANFEITSIVNTEVLFTYDDTINSLASVTLNTGSTFVSTGANTTSVSANLASANISSTIVSSLGTSNVTVGSIGSIEKLSGGSGYTSEPTVTIRQDNIADQKLSDGSGGIKGFNAVVNANVVSTFLGNNAILLANNITGAILSVDVNEAGGGYLRTDSLNIVNQTTANTENARGNPVISGVINYPGKFTDTKGFLSWNNVLQDNFFYQVYSYVIKSEQNVDQYRQLVDRILHPAGEKFFGFKEINPIIDNTELFSIKNEYVIQPQILSHVDTLIPVTVSDRSDINVPLIADQVLTFTENVETVLNLNLTANLPDLAVVFTLTLDIQDVGINQEFLVQDIVIEDADDTLFLTESGEALSPTANVAFNETVYIPLHTFGDLNVNYQITVPSFTSIANTTIIGDLQIQPFAAEPASFFAGDTFDDIFVQDRFGPIEIVRAITPASIVSTVAFSTDLSAELNITGFTILQNFSNNEISTLSAETVEGYGGTPLNSSVAFAQTTVENA